MAVIQSFRDLEAWRAAMDLSVGVYSVSMRLPTEERFGLMSQMRRASFPYRRMSLRATAMGRMVDTSNTSGSRSDHWESCRRNSNSLSG